MIWRDARRVQALENFQAAHRRRHVARGGGYDYSPPTRAPSYTYTHPHRPGVTRPWREERLVEARPTGHVLQQALAAVAADAAEQRADAELSREWERGAGGRPWLRFVADIADGRTDAPPRLVAAARRAERARNAR
jgi:hypothetical protein